MCVSVCVSVYVCHVNVPNAKKQGCTPHLQCRVACILFLFLFAKVQKAGFLLDKPLEYAWIHHLGNAIVHDFIQQFVNKHKVALDGIHAKIPPKVGLEQVDHLGHKLQRQHGIAVERSHAHDKDIVVADVDECG